jgi:16S rRNA (guanine527-N7)-methyltransferase
MSNNVAWLNTVSTQNGLHLTDKMLVQFDTLVEQLLSWNEKINLISRRDVESIWSAHILHSLTILLKLQLPAGSAVLDLGTGGGLPGLCLKIARPDLQLTLLDSTQKKINVVREIAASLMLDDVRAVWGRAEDLGRQQAYERKHDIVVARAVASLRNLVRWSLPFLREQARPEAMREEKTSDERPWVRGPALVALKGGDLEGEMRQIRHEAAVKSIKLMGLTLRGSQQLEAGDKKIVLVSFHIGQSTKRKLK